MAVVVGADRGLDGEVPLRWAEREARAFHTLLLELGRVRPSDARLLTGRSADELRDVFSLLGRRIADLRAAGGEVQLLFYYSGHASATALHLDGERLPLRELRASLAGTEAHAVVAFVDACKSGALVRRKGLEVLPPFELRADGLTKTRGRVLVTSSAAAEVSVEADELEGSVFSHYLLSGLRGDADADGDGRVELREAYAHAYHGTVRRTAESPLGTQHPSYDFDMSGSGDVVLTWLDQAEARLTVGPGMAGSYLIVAKYSRRVVAELTVGPDEEKTLALPAQSYIVKKRAEGGYLTGEVNLLWGGTHTLAASDLVFVAYADVARKGEVPEDRVDLVAGFTVRNGVVSGNPYLLGASLAVRIRVAAQVQLEAELGFATGHTTTRDGEVRTHGAELHLGAAYLQELGALRLGLGLSPGGSVFWQQVPDWPDALSPGFTAAAVANLAWVVADPFLQAASVRGGVEVQREAGSWTGSPFVTATTGLGIRF